MSLRTWDTTPISIEGPHGWDNTRVAIRSEKYCPWWLTFLKPGTGEVFDYGDPCRSFTHRECAQKRVERLLDHIGPFLFNSRKEIWVATGDYDDRLATRMRVRRNKVKEESGEEVHALWVRRTSGVFYYFGTAELEGRTAPQTGHWMDSDAAYVVARAALTVPSIGDRNGRKGVTSASGGDPGQRRRHRGWCVSPKVIRSQPR